MSRYTLSPDRLFDRPWRAGHPFRPRTGRARRLFMSALLLVLSLVIFGYAYLTDARRVRQMAESYLSGLIGGKVRVEGATLSIFEGLRLDGVKVYVDAQEPHGGPAADALIFSARTFVIQYDPRSMLKGQLQATQIIAEKPHVHLTQDLRTGEWNFHRLRHDRPPVPTPATPAKPSPMPEVLLRNARVEIAELRDKPGSAGFVKASLGYFAIDGQLTPEPNDQCGFLLQSRGLSDAMGPLISGSVNLGTGHVAAQLKQLEFGQDVRSILLADVRAWTQRHELAGRVDIPAFDYLPPSDGKPARFMIETVLNGVNIAVPPEDWMSGEEIRRRRTTQESFDVLRSAFLVGGFGDEHALGSLRLSAEPVATDAALSLASPDPAPPAAPLRTPIDGPGELLEAPPIRLRRASGTFVFNQDGITVTGLTGRLENNGFKINGRIDGYHPEAGLALRIASLDNEDLNIPAAPRYIWSLPPGVREFYELLRPQGTCRLRIDVSRPAGAGALQCDGWLDVINAQIAFKEFPYPLRELSGRVRYGRDPRNGLDWISLAGLRGKGIAGGPNQDSIVAIDGWVGPTNPGTGEPGGRVLVRADDVRYEPALLAALKPPTRNALRIFDAPGRGEMPRFRAAFNCDVHRRVGREHDWNFDIDVRLHDATAALIGFPYPLHNVTGLARIRDGYADLEGIQMTRAGMTLQVDGRVGWDPPEPAKHVGEPLEAGIVFGEVPETRLTLTGRGLPVDNDLLAALPPEQGSWIRSAGLGGMLDVDGTLIGRLPHSESAPRGGTGSGSDPAPTSAPSLPPGALRHDLALRLRGGSLHPPGGDFEVTDVTAALRVTPDIVELSDMHGRRGDADFSAVATMWPGEHPQLQLRAAGKAVATDAALHAILPAAAQEAWDELQPAGTLDADLTYAGPLTGGADALAPPVTIDLTRSPAVPTTGPATAAAAIAPGLNAVLRPRKLSVTLRSFPYRLDALTGAVVLSPGQVALTDITARHGDATLKIAGAGALGERSTWDLKVSGEQIEADEELRHALPPTLITVIDGLKLKGKLGLELSHLGYKAAAPAADPHAAPGSEAPAGAAALDLAGALTLDGASMDVGVPLEKVVGRLNLSAAVRDDQLAALAGDMDLASLTFAGRPVRAFKANIAKDPATGDLQFANLQASVAGGDLAGTARILNTDEGPSRYTLALVMRNADVKDLAGEADPNIRGRLTASLSLEGAWGKPDSRRGRGDVAMNGKDMYRIPLMLGLMQITNLALPINAPFNNATARYSVDGQRVAFEKIELRSNNLLMTGDGSLDFSNKQVRMTFVTDNPGGFKIPFVQDLWRGAQQELLRIQVKGTVQEPKVEAGMFGTFTTTVDEVFKGDPPKPGRAKKN